MIRSRKLAGFITLLAAMCIGSPLAAQGVTDPTAPADPPKPGSPALTFTGVYLAEVLDDAGGGLRRGGDYLQLVKLSADYNGAAAGRDSLSGHVTVAQVSGSDFTARRVGGVQNISSSEAEPPTLRLYEAWLRGDFAAGKADVKAGVIDLNANFDVQETAGLFFNASYGIGAEIGDTGLNGPSIYPTPALGVIAAYRPAEGWTAQFGAFDGVSGDPAHRSAFAAARFDGGALLIGQIERRFGDRARIEAGAWTYTAAFPSLSQIGAGGAPRQIHGDDGVYGLIEGRLIPKGDNQGLNGWVRIGVANGDINTVATYLGAGVVYTGPFKGHEQDQVGLAVARAGFGAGARRQGALAGRDIGPAETELEVTYRYVFKDWLAIQPDLQYVIDPQADRRIPNALVLGLRLAFSFSK